MPRAVRSCRRGEGLRGKGFGGVQIKSVLTNQDALGSAALPQVCQTYETQCRANARFGKDHLSNRTASGDVMRAWLPQCYGRRQVLPASVVVQTSWSAVSMGPC